MLRVEIIEILRTSKKYSKSNFMYDIDGIHYSINNHTYTITLDGGFSKKLTFRYENYSLNVEPIKISFIRSNIDDKKILYKFGQIIKYINKLDSIIY